MHDYEFSFYANLCLEHDVLEHLVLTEVFLKFHNNFKRYKKV